MTLSRRNLLASSGLILAGSIAGCLGGNEDIDVEISNLTESPIDYRMQIEEFEEEGSLQTEESDEFVDVLSQPDSATEYEADISFGVAFDLGEGENSSDDDNGSEEEGSGFFEAGSIDDPVNVNEDVVRISVTYSEEEIVITPIVGDE